ncbi:MAG: ArsA family ATPase [Deltaproteobacteria bacterium]|nr:ArsA family ATPase [Deltaproteobacteria bacterium]
MNTLNPDHHRETRVLLVCGSGGVGKTTIAAAMGLKMSLAGYKTIVLTIDPAKRLADSLGIKSLSDEPEKITLPENNGGEMWAMMLDTKRTFDRIIEKYASSAETRNKIINNKLYQHMSQMLAGTQEYMAMERLYEIYKQNTFDVMIVDTPPVQNARDFLSAPQRMMNMINNSMLHLLLKPSLSLGKSGLKFLERGSQQILKAFDRITGFAFLQEMSEMIVAFKDLLGGFETRASEVNSLLKLDTTHFVIVCTTNANSIMETQDFFKQISDQGFNLKKIIINRVYEGNVLSPEKIKSCRDELVGQFSPAEADLLIDNYRLFVPMIKKDKRQITSITNSVGNDYVSTIPLFLSDVHDIKTLKMVADVMGWLDS